MGIDAEGLLQEVRKDVKNLTASFADFKGRVVMKDEIDLWREAQRTTKRWAIGTALTMATIAVAAVATASNL